MSTPLTVESISAALRGSDFWLTPNSDAAQIVTEAARLGYVTRLSHTQAQWTDAGLAKARPWSTASCTISKTVRETARGASMGTTSRPSRRVGRPDMTTFTHLDRAERRLRVDVDVPLAPYSVEPGREQEVEETIHAAVRGFFAGAPARSMSEATALQVEQVVDAAIRRLEDVGAIYRNPWKTKIVT